MDWLSLAVSFAGITFQAQGRTAPDRRCVVVMPCRWAQAILTQVRRPDLGDNRCNLSDGPPPPRSASTICRAQADGLRSGPVRTGFEISSMPANQDGPTPALDRGLRFDRTMAGIDGHAAASAQVSLVHGAARSISDPRRRRGGHGQARQLLAGDGRSFEPISQLWRGLASALQWHTLHAGLAALREEERQVLRMAYLEGHTNREIAAMLSVSVSTVRRRLTIALANLDQHLTRTGAWISAVALLALSYAMRRTGLGRLTKLAAPGATHSAVLLTAAGAAGAIAVGLVVISLAPPVQHASPSQAVTGLTRLPNIAGASIPLTSKRPDVVNQHGANASAGHGSSTQTTQSTSQGDTKGLGCKGNPTNAPPNTPVAGPGSHPTGAPVTHPAAGGCGPHS